MKRTFILFFLIIIIFCTCYSQTDTVVIIKTDTVFAPEKQDRLYKFFVESKEADIRHLWKVNLADIGLQRANITFEQRLPKSWSAEGCLSFGYNWIKPSSSEFFWYDTSPLHHHRPALSSSSVSVSGESLEIEQLFKYYYNLNKRERHGKRTNGFSGNYFATSILFNNIDTPSDLNTDDYYAESGRNINLGIKYGIQRRIGNLGYVEVYTGLYYRWESVKFVPTRADAADADKWTFRDDYAVLKIGIRVGFAIDTFDNLRKMIKN